MVIMLFTVYSADTCGQTIDLCEQYSGLLAHDSSFWSQLNKDKFKNTFKLVAAASQISNQETIKFTKKFKFNTDEN